MVEAVGAEERAIDVVRARGEAYARDALGEIRAVLGDALVRKIGARAFEPPPFAKGRRIFERCGVPDPWDPMAPTVDVALGDVGLSGRKLPASADPNRRQPAPHASAPKGPAPAAARPALPPGFRPPDVASAPKAGKPAPKIGDVRPDDTAKLKRDLEEKGRRKVSERSIESTRVKQPVKNLPVRPGLSPDGAAPGQPTAATSVPVARPATPVARAPESGGGASSPVQRSLPPVNRPASGGARPPGPAVAPRVAMASSRPSASSGPVELPLAPPRRDEEDDAFESGGPGDIFASGARSSARPAAGALYGGPEELPMEPTAGPSVGAAPVERPAPEPARPPAAPPRAPPRPGGGNLDDLFGMGGGEQGRLKFGAPSEEPRPRRPRVTDPSQAPGGVDRRPPPPKPPVVVPTGPAPSAPKDDLPDE